MKKHDYFRLLYMVDRQLTFNQLIYAMLLCFVIMLSLARFKYELHSCMFQQLVMKVNVLLNIAGEWEGAREYKIYTEEEKQQEKELQ